VIICADNDAAGEGAAKQASVRWMLEDRVVRIARPPPGKDWNDLVMGSGDGDKN
jgi:DNA primase